MTPAEQAAADKFQTVNVHIVANGYIVGYPGERRVYRTEEDLLDDLGKFLYEFRKKRPMRTGTPWVPNKEQE